MVYFHTSVGFCVTYPTAMAMLGPQGVEWLNVEFPRLSFFIVKSAYIWELVSAKECFLSRLVCCISLGDLFHTLNENERKIIN